MGVAEEGARPGSSGPDEEAASSGSTAADNDIAGSGRSGAGDSAALSSGSAAETASSSSSSAAHQEAVAKAAALWGMRLELGGSGGRALAKQRPPKRSIGRRAMAGRLEADPSIGAAAAALCMPAFDYPHCQPVPQHWPRALGLPVLRNA